MSDWEEKAEIVIVGSGFAGLAAAIEAANAGAFPVTIVEKMPTPGGNSIYSAGQLAAVCSEQQMRAKIEDSVDCMMKDMLRAGQDLNHIDLLRKLVESSNETVEWTKKVLGVKYRERVSQLGGHSVPRTLSTKNASGRDIIDPMLEIIRHHPSIHMLLSTKVDRIITNPTTGRVHGIEVSDTLLEESFEIGCTKALILAAGGFSADVEFRAIQNPLLNSEVMTTNQPGATAEMMKEALKSGAMSVQLSRIQLGSGTSPDEPGFGQAPLFCAGAGFPYGIIIDPETSQRFINELASPEERNMSILKKGHPVICLADTRGAKHSIHKNLKKLEPAVRSFDSLTAMAGAFNLDEVVLAHTVANYNRGLLAEDRQDEFGKPLREDALPIEIPPFYATRLWPKVHHCMGGLQIDNDARVINIDGHPIPGLFAAGEIVGGVHGADRLGSCATLDCLVYGRIAGKNAAAFDIKD